MIIMKATTLNLRMTLHSSLGLGVTTIAVGVCSLKPQWNRWRRRYQSDPNTNRRNDIRDNSSYTHWIIGGVVGLAIVIAAAAFISTGATRASPKQPRLLLL